jgi:hypothetical protein
MPRRPADPVKRAAIASVGPADSTIAGRVHAAWTGGLPASVAGLPVQIHGQLHENDVPTMRHRWRAAAYHLTDGVEDATAVYRAAWGFPGLLVLHAFVLDDVVRALVAADQRISWASHREIAEARADLGRDPRGGFVPSVSPSVAAIVRRARGLVVFAEAARDYLDALGVRTPVTVLAPPVLDTRAATEAAAAGAAGRRESLPGCRRLVVVPTDRAEAGPVATVLDAVRGLDAGVHVALVGSGDPGRDVMGLGAAESLGDRIHVQHDLPETELLTWLAAADAIVDLRRPHHVEVAVGMLRALASGRAVVAASDAVTPGTPADAVLAVDPGIDDGDLGAIVASLLGDEPRSRSLGAAATAFVSTVRSSGASGYAEALARSVEVAMDPIRPAMDRWADALADLGAGEEHLEAGYFLRYARALTSFRRSPSEPDRSAGGPLLDSG